LMRDCTLAGSMEKIAPIALVVELAPSGSQRSATSGLVWNMVAEHREAALRLDLRRFLLEHVPMLGELAVFEADDVSGDPGRLSSVPGEAAICDDIIALSENELVFIAQRVRKRVNQVEQPVASGLDMGTVLNISVGPVAFGNSVVTPIEERVKCLEDKRLVLFR
jgi:hypothetical protein